MIAAVRDELQFSFCGLQCPAPPGYKGVKSRFRNGVPDRSAAGAHRIDRGREANRAKEGGDG